MIERFHLTFMAAARHLSFTRAAQELCLTQPAVSQHIRALEELYGLRLFSKVGRQLRLSPAGTVLNRHLEEAETIARDLQHELRNLSSTVKRFKLGATLTIGEYVLPPILGSYARQFSNHEIQLSVENTAAITRGLLADQLDLGFIEGPFDRKLFEATLYRADELILVAAASSELAQRRSVSLAELAGLKLILREPGSGTRHSFEEALLAAGRPPIPACMSIGSLTTIKSMVESGLGYTIISRLAVAKELKAGTLVAVAIEGFEVMREFNLIYRKSGPTEFIQGFTDFCLKSSRA